LMTRSSDMPAFTSSTIASTSPGSAAWGEACCCAGAAAGAGAALAEAFFEAGVCARMVVETKTKTTRRVPRILNLLLERVRYQIADCWKKARFKPHSRAAVVHWRCDTIQLVMASAQYFSFLPGLLGP